MSRKVIKTTVVLEDSRPSSAKWGSGGEFMDPKEFRKWVRCRLAAKGWTVKMLAEKMEVQYSYLQGLVSCNGVWPTIYAGKALFWLMDTQVLEQDIIPENAPTPEWEYQPGCACERWSRKFEIPFTYHHPSCRKYDIKRESYNIVKFMMDSVERLSKRVIELGGKLYEYDKDAMKRGKVFLGEAPARWANVHGVDEPKKPCLLDYYFQPRKPKDADYTTARADVYEGDQPSTPTPQEGGVS